MPGWCLYVSGGGSGLLHGQLKPSKKVALALLVGHICCGLACIVPHLHSNRRRDATVS